MAKTIVPSKELNDESRERVRRVAELKPGARIHIAGVCGTGTASVLTLLKALGYHVTGSDKAFYPPMGDVVRSEADHVFEGYSAENLRERPDLVVIGNSLSRNNPEVEYVLEHDIPFASMPEVFAALLIGDRNHCPTSIVIAGTHGKTTTTSATSVLFDEAGRKPGYFIGGMPNDLPGSIRPVDLAIPVAERVVVLEGDEYDSAFFAKYSKFHSYRPDVLVVTSLEFDHADIYNSIEEIELEFTRCARRVPKFGYLVVEDSGERLGPLVERWKSDPEIAATIVRYGERPSSEFKLLKRTVRPGEGNIRQSLEMELSGLKITCETQLSGAQNAYNLLAVAAVGKLLGLTPDQIQRGIAKFSGVARRQNVIGDKNGILIIEDFAHHPTAVQLTLEGLKEIYPGRRLVAVFEPRSNTSRRNFFQEQYARSFGAADIAVIQELQDTTVYSNTGAFVPFSVTKLVEDLKANGVNAVSEPNVERIIARLKETVAEGDVVVLMSNGDFGGLPRRLPASL
ncbi:MAG: Mur ligase family protein [Bdellovibrionota bacterium]